MQKRSSKQHTPPSNQCSVICYANSADSAVKNTIQENIIRIHFYMSNVFLYVKSLTVAPQNTAETTI